MAPERGTRHAPRLAIGPGGRPAAEASGSYDWIVHRGEAPVAFLVSPLAGLGAGDVLDAAVSVAAGAAATVTGQAPTALLATARACTHRVSFELEAGAHVTYLPWLALPFPGARARLEAQARLAPGASLVAWETLAAGRVARGERFAFAELAASWRIEGADGLLLDDRLSVRGSDRSHAEAMLGGRSHVGTLYVAGLGGGALEAAEARELLRGAADLAGASSPAPGVLVARALDTSGERLERAFWPIVQRARAALGLPRLDPGRIARRWLGST